MKIKKLIDAVEKHKDLVLENERNIWKNPKTGYKEHNIISGGSADMGYRIVYKDDGLPLYPLKTDKNPQSGKEI